jgi:ABC-2 type transport system ATP-binding protein
MHVEARIVSTEAPIDGAINVEPTLEDLYLKYFSDGMEAGEKS